MIIAFFKLYEKSYYGEKINATKQYFFSKTVNVILMSSNYCRANIIVIFANF